MGNCVSNHHNERRLEETINAESDNDRKVDGGSKARNKQIDKYMKDVAKKEGEIVKILLLGAGSSGKSTLFRQIECIHGEEPDDIDNNNENEYHNMDRFFVNMDSMKRIMRSNCVNGLIKLLQKSDLLSKQPYNLNQCSIDINNQNIENAIKTLVSFAQNSNQEMEMLNANDLNILGDAIFFLWDLHGVKETFKHRHYFSLTENMNYFLDKIKLIMNEEYEPSIEDILNARMQTTGIIERVYFIERVQFNIFDVGGQRNERRKWIQLFDKVHGLIFVAALNHYCCVLFEDETMNAMQESLQLFEEIVNAKWFTSKHTQFILFLNKNDLFIERLKNDKIPLSICFNNEYKGSNYNDKSLDNMTDIDRDKWFEICYKESITFIQDKYLLKNNNNRITSIFTHITTATEKSNVEKVFDDVRMGIISQSLANSGFHIDMQVINDTKQQT